MFKYHFVSHPGPTKCTPLKSYSFLSPIRFPDLWPVTPPTHQLATKCHESHTRSAGPILPAKVELPLNLKEFWYELTAPPAGLVLSTKELQKTFSENDKDYCYIWWLYRYSYAGLCVCVCACVRTCAIHVYVVHLCSLVWLKLNNYSNVSMPYGQHHQGIAYACI